MKSKKIISLILTCAFLLTGCGVSKETQVTTTATTATSETTAQTTVQQKFAYNPHPYSKKLSERIPQENWDALYNLSDAIRKGESTFKCASEEAYKWCTDITVLCCLIPPAGTKIEGKSDDGSKAFENGTGVAWANDNTEVIAFAAENEGYTVGIDSLGSADTIAPAVTKGNESLLNWLNEEIVELGKENFFHADYEATLVDTYGIEFEDTLVIEGGGN